MGHATWIAKVHWTVRLSGWDDGPPSQPVLRRWAAASADPTRRSSSAPPELDALGIGSTPGHAHTQLRSRELHPLTLPLSIRTDKIAEKYLNNVPPCVRAPNHPRNTQAPRLQVASVIDKGDRARAAERDRRSCPGRQAETEQVPARILPPSPACSPIPSKHCPGPDSRQPDRHHRRSPCDPLATCARQPKQPRVGPCPPISTSPASADPCPVEACPS